MQQIRGVDRLSVVGPSHARIASQVPGSMIDQSRVETLYAAEMPRIVRLAYLLTADEQTAEDIAQDVFSRFLVAGAGVRDGAAYVSAMTVNACRDHHRRRNRAFRHAREAMESSPEPDLPTDLSPIWLAVQRLPQSQREVVVLRYWADLTTGAIADHVGKPPGTVRSLLTRATAALREELER
jgi:RNA polymerase sigma factor (sigma-70 family)